MGAVVADAGGEILKFMGDGMLAIFAVPAGDDPAETALRAVRAAGSASDAILVLNRVRAAAGEPTVRFGLALHIGEVMFGNIGASQRLDFTVIGPAVNHAARLEKLCSALDPPVIPSSALVSLRPDGQSVPPGRHTPKGIDEPQAVVGLR